MKSDESIEIKMRCQDTDETWINGRFLERIKLVIENCVTSKNALNIGMVDFRVPSMTLS